MDRLFSTPFGELDLTRSPEDPRDPFRAWDAADAYLLRRLAGLPGPGGEAPAPVGLDGDVVVLGDRWGALTTALAGHRPTLVTDSYLSAQATRANLARNAPEADVRILTSREAPPKRADVLLVRVPKSLALLEDQLHRIAPAVHADTVVMGTGMVTEIHTSTLELFTRILGPTRTSPAEKKARLIFTAPGPAEPPAANPWPLRYPLPDGIGAASGRTVVNHAGVFCADRLDIGTRLLLANLPGPAGRPTEVVDLGCGNGVVGTAVALADPLAHVTFVDESYQAVASAEATFRTNLPDTPADFRVADALADFPPGTADLVLTNPPFHSHQATTDAVAWRMFAGARAALRPGGELRIVGNRHLAYHTKLKRLFGNCTTLASTPKFVILSTRKP